MRFSDDFGATLVFLCFGTQLRLSNCRRESNLIVANLTKGTIIGCVVTSLVGCAAGSYPTQTQVDNTAKTIPPLNTIAEGRAYLQIVRKNMADERDVLQRIDYGLDAGIVGGAITVALGTALHWGGHSTIKAGIFTGAVLGVESTLSLKTQEQIINKGLDALNCVESQAEAAYVSVRPVDAVLALIDQDIKNLETGIDKLKSQNADGSFSDVLTQAQTDLAAAKLWVSIETIPVVTVNTGVKIGVNAVLQTTVDQLNTALPDGSAFSKISTSFPPQVTPTTTPPVPKQTVPQIITPSLRELASVTIAKKDLSDLATRLNIDMAAAKSALEALGPIKLNAPLPTINCAVSTVTQPLQLSAVSGLIVPNSGSSASATITGGTIPYKLEITAGSSGLTPEVFTKSLVGGSVVLTGSSALKPGIYNMVITDATATMKTTTVTVTATALAPRLTNQTTAQTWQQNKNVSLILAADTFTDPQGEALVYSATQSNGLALPAWLHFDGVTRTFSSVSPPAAGSLTLKVTATNGFTPSLSTSESFTVTVQ